MAAQTEFDPQEEAARVRARLFDVPGGMSELGSTPTGTGSVPAWMFGQGTGSILVDVHSGLFGPDPRFAPAISVSPDGATVTLATDTPAAAGAAKQVILSPAFNWLGALLLLAALWMLWHVRL